MVIKFVEAVVMYFMGYFIESIFNIEMLSVNRLKFI